MLSVGEIRQALQARLQLTAERSELLARMANGSFTRALQLVENQTLVEHRALVLEFFRLVYIRPGDRLIDLIERLAGMGREQAKGVLDLMLLWIRDLVLYQTMGAEAPIINVDQKEAIHRFCTHVRKARLDLMTNVIEEAMDLTVRNVNQVLVFTVLAQALHRAMHGHEIKGLIHPLAEPLVRRSSLVARRS